MSESQHSYFSPAAKPSPMPAPRAIRPTQLSPIAHLKNAATYLSPMERMQRAAHHPHTYERRREFERRRSHRMLPPDPNQLALFEENFLQTQYNAASILPSALDQSSIENFSISLAYGDDGFGIVGTTLIALSMTDSNGDGKIDHHDLFPDKTPVQGLNLDLNALREGMMEKVRELVARFDTNGNGRIDGPDEAFAFLRHVADLDLDVTSAYLDPKSGMITTESYIRAFGEHLHRGLIEQNG